MATPTSEVTCPHCTEPASHVKNTHGVSQMSCTQMYGGACRCIRLSGACVRCGREVTVTNGERADRLPHEKGRLIGYLCVRCR